MTDYHNPFQNSVLTKKPTFLYIMTIRIANQPIIASLSDDIRQVMLFPNTVNLDNSKLTGLTLNSL